LLRSNGARRTNLPAPRALELSLRRLVTALWILGALFFSAACGPAQSGPQEQAPTPLSGFNLQGTWKLYDHLELPIGCEIRMWAEGDKWNGWILQDFTVIQECTLVEYRLDRVQMDGTRITLWFRHPDTQRRREFRLEIVSPSLLRQRSSNTPHTLVKVSG
jgi:hypothetical protein